MQLRLKIVSLKTRNIEQFYGTVGQSVRFFKLMVQSNAVNGFNFNPKSINGEKCTLKHFPTQGQDLKKEAQPV